MNLKKIKRFGTFIQKLKPIINGHANKQLKSPNHIPTFLLKAVKMGDEVRYFRIPKD